MDRNFEPTTGIEPVTSSFAYTSVSLHGYRRARLYLLAHGEPLSVVRAFKKRHGLARVCRVLTVIRDSHTGRPMCGRGFAAHQGRALPTELRRQMLSIHVDCRPIISRNNVAAK